MPTVRMDQPRVAFGIDRAGHRPTARTSRPQNYLPIRWPGWATTAWHEDAGTQPVTGYEHYWFGSLVNGMRDASGQVYMRNRYYDPATGQFTQPDPIGLAGGLNSYGFAAGDPVSYSDPFGLNPCAFPNLNPQECAKQAALAMMQAGVRWLGAVADAIGARELGEAATGVSSESGGRVGTGSRVGLGLFGGIQQIPGGGQGSRVASRLVRSDGSLRVSRTVAPQLGGERAYIPSLAILEAVRGGTRTADPQGVAGHFMYTVGVEWTIGGKTSKGTLEVLVDEGRNVINHVLYRSK